MIGVLLFLGGQARRLLFPCHIGLFNNPHMNSILGKNSICGQGNSCYGEVMLGHSFLLILLDQVLGHTCQIMGLICPLRTFFSLGRFFPGTFCPLGRFVLWDVLSLGRFVLRRFLWGRFVCESLPLGRMSSFFPFSLS